MKIKTILFANIFITIFSSCQPKDSETEFWDWFSKNEKRIYNFENDQEKIFDELNDKLVKIDSNLTFEFSPIHKNQIREFTISADGIKESFPVVIKLVEKAPKFRNWKINAFRQRVPGDDIEIKFGDFKISYNDIYFRYGKDSNKIGLELNIRNFKDNPEFNNAIYVLMDGLIGEYDMETKIGWIERKSLDETKTDSLYRIVELREVVDKIH